MRCVCDGGMVWICGLSGHQRAHVAFFISLFLFLIWFWTTIGATTTRTVIKICRTQTIGINDYAGLTRLLVLSAWINEGRVTPGWDRRDKFVEGENWDIRPRAFCQFVSLVSVVEWHYGYRKHCLFTASLVPKAIYYPVCVCAARVLCIFRVQQKATNTAERQFSFRQPD